MKTSTANEDLHFKQTCQRLLRIDMGVIPCTILDQEIELDAANLLVEHGLLIYRVDLLLESDDWEPDGYIKLMDDEIDDKFVQHLLMFDITPSVWLRTACLPDVWRSRLSINSISYLNTMSVYREKLNSSSRLSCNNEHACNYANEQMEDSILDSQNFAIEEEAENGNIQLFVCSLLFYFVTFIFQLLHLQGGSTKFLLLM